LITLIDLIQKRAGKTGNALQKPNTPGSTFQTPKKIVRLNILAKESHNQNRVFLNLSNERVVCALVRQMIEMQSHHTCLSEGIQVSTMAVSALRPFSSVRSVCEENPWHIDIIPS
jgi:hypothetical protein